MIGTHGHAAEIVRNCCANHCRESGGVYKAPPQKGTLRPGGGSIRACGQHAGMVPRAPRRRRNVILPVVLTGVSCPNGMSPREGPLVQDAQRYTVMSSASETSPAKRYRGSRSGVPAPPGDIAPLCVAASHARNDSLRGALRSEVDPGLAGFRPFHNVGRRSKPGMTICVR